MRTVKAALVAAIAIVALIVSLLPGLAEESGSLALTISIDGAIGPASASYVKDALARAGERRAEIVILRLNTPGGLNTSMREIIADVLASPVPVIGYVAPSGLDLACVPTFADIEIDGQDRTAIRLLIETRSEPTPSLNLRGSAAAAY